MAKIIKRDNRKVDYDVKKIESAICKAIAQSRGEDVELGLRLTTLVDIRIKELFKGPNRPNVEQIQDIVEQVLVEENLTDIAKEYIVYRSERNKARAKRNRLMQTINELTFSDSRSVDSKRENANVDTDTAMGTMLKYGSEVSKDYTHLFLLDKDASEAHINGDIHIHDLDFYALTETCLQIPLDQLFNGGFNTGYGSIREPGNVRSSAALTAIALQCNQNEMHGGQSIPALDHYLAKYVAITYVKTIILILEDFYEIEVGVLADFKIKMLQYLSSNNDRVINKDGETFIYTTLYALGVKLSEAQKAVTIAHKWTVRDSEQAMESLVHNLNSMHSRAGSQVPFTSVNFGTDTSEEGRIISKSLLLAVDSGMGAGETAIFPISIFKVKEGVNYNPGDPNYDLFQLSIKVSAKRLFPTYNFLDAPFNLQYYKPGDFRSEIATMGCRTRVIANVNDETRQITQGRGNLSFTSINLPRIGIESEGDIDKFFEILDERMDLTKRQLLKRYKLQCDKHVYNYPFLMGQGLWMDSDKLDVEDTLEEVLAHGSLSIGFIGLAECLVALIGEHHGQSDRAQELGLRIIGHMREVADTWQKEEYTTTKGTKQHLNWSILATPAEGLSGTFVSKDRKRYGVIEGVTDKDYYTNSNHIPVGFPIGFTDKIKKEAPYHALTNAGHICYIEFDGDALQNLEAFESIIRTMKDNGIGYGAINIPIDRDPVCEYTGVITDVCPKCGRDVREPIDIVTIREIRKRLGITCAFNGDKTF